MYGARAHQCLGPAGQLAFAVAADGLGRLDVTEGHGDLGDRPGPELFAAAAFALDHPAALTPRFFHVSLPAPSLLRQAGQVNVLRRAEGRMPSAWRYLATVRRAILIWSRRRISAMAWSDSGSCGCSSATIARIFSFTV